MHGSYVDLWCMECVYGLWMCVCCMWYMCVVYCVSVVYGWNVCLVCGICVYGICMSSIWSVCMIQYEVCVSMVYGFVCGISVYYGMCMWCIPVWCIGWHGCACLLCKWYVSGVCMYVVYIKFVCGVWYVCLLCMGCM